MHTFVFFEKNFMILTKHSPFLQASFGGVVWEAEKEHE